MTCDGVEPMVDAYVDGELDVERALAVEAHVAGCAACAARLERARALARTMKTAPYFRAPEALVRRVRATSAAASATAHPRRPDATPGRQHRWSRWLIPVASAAVVVLAVAGLLSRGAAPDDVTMEAVIEGHVRSLMADHLTDVISSDRHTVKPWFAGRIDFSPTVADLESEGFPLMGGRLDYIDHHAAAALIYKRREHVINVFVWPASGGLPTRATRSDGRGYHVVFWTNDGVAVWVVSDLALDELDAFAQKLDAAIRH
jgi:anti-sigma factor RsiW